MKHFPLMISTLHKSIGDIVTAAPENRDELIKISFGEFEQAMGSELAKAVEDGTEEELAKLDLGGDDEEPMFKGLGCVGRVAELMSRVAEQIKRITEGKSYSSDDDNDPASEQVAALLEHMLQIGELALRAAVNEHVDPVGDDEDAEDGMNYVEVPNAEDPSDAASMVVKTVLPMELAKFACDPASLTLAAVEHGAGLMLLAGVPEETLGKLFGIDSGFARAGFRSDVLSKDAGMQPGAQDLGGQDMSEPQGTDPNDLVAQVEILGRIAAASLMQVDHVMTLLGAQGGDDGAGMDQGGAGQGGVDDAGGAMGQGDGSTAADDPTAAAQAAPPDGTDPAASGDATAAPDTTAAPDPKKKPFGKDAPVGGLAKADPEVAALRGQIATMQQQMTKLSGDNPELIQLRRQVDQMSRQPAPAKGVVQVTGLSKAADAGGDGNDDLAKIASDYDRCRTDDDRRRVLLKAAIKFPGMDLSELQKTQ